MTISTNYGLSSSGYYSLAQSGSTAVTTSTTNAAKTAAASSAENANLSAYLLDLSPEARDYLNNSAVSAVSGFTLSKTQQSAIDAILQKYKDQPYTQDTFNQIQADLQQAGLSPDQLAQQQQVKDFNPTQTLINALSGKESDNSDALGLLQNDGSQYDSQKQNFVQGLIDKFKKIAAPEATS